MEVRREEGREGRKRGRKGGRKKEIWWVGRKERRHGGFSDSKDKMPLDFTLSVWCRILNAHGFFNVQAFV